ncbi:hypothetical protein ACFVG7_29385, partial [Streptomyces sp. NPDC127112]
MRLTRFTDLALRVLMRLAVEDAELPTTREVAATMEVPYTHTAKVVALRGPPWSGRPAAARPTPRRAPGSARCGRGPARRPG